jgi:hypothetical protein
MTSLEGWGSAIELRPRVPVGGAPNTGVSIDSVPGFAASGPNRPLMARQGSARAPTFGSGTDRQVGYGSVPRDVAQLG